MVLSLHFRALLVAVTVVIVAEDLQYLCKLEAMGTVRVSASFENSLCAECQEDGENKTEEEESSKEEIKKKDENRNLDSVALLSLHKLTTKTILRHAIWHLSDVAPELETPPPEF
jgi:hypothetical protein